MVSNQFTRSPGMDINNSASMNCKQSNSPPHEVIRLKNREQVLPRDFLSVQSELKDVCAEQTKVMSIEQKPAEIGEAFPKAIAKMIQIDTETVDKVEQE